MHNIILKICRKGLFPAAVLIMCGQIGRNLVNVHYSDLCCTLMCLFVRAARLFHQAFISFRKYALESTSLPADLHIILSDICCGAGLSLLRET